MGSPVSHVVANLCMEEIVELAHTCSQSILPPKKWSRFVDDIFSIIKKQALTNIFNLLNLIDTHIKFTIEHDQTENYHFWKSCLHAIMVH